MNIKAYPFIIVTLCILIVTFIFDNNLAGDVTVNPESEWQLQKWQFVSPSQKDMKALSQLNLWNEVKVEQIVSVKGWQLKGIVNEDESSYILVLREGSSKLEQFGLNERLPNGEVLLQIGQNAITIEDLGESKQILLHDSASRVKLESQ